MNNDNDRELRRLRVALYSRGEGVILFSLWSCIEVILMFFSSSTLLESLTFPEYDTTILTVIFYIVFCVIMVLILGVNLAMNIYIGRSAIGFSRGRPIRRAPLVWCGIYAALYLAALTIGLAISIFAGSFLLNIISSAVDIFVVALHIQIIVFSRRLKKAEA